jgi:hypothetical protein
MDPGPDRYCSGMVKARDVRTLARLCGTYHNISYFAPETLAAFTAAGVPRYWHAYLGYRSAPMGRVPAAVVVACFYNFSPRRVNPAIPSIWEHISPQEAIAIRDRSVDRALRRVLGDGVIGTDVMTAATLTRAAVEGCDMVGRPLFAAHTELPWPDEPHMQLHHACTLWREHRGDSHNIALAAAEVDGIECHVLLAGTGVTNGRVIEKLRGWSDEEWSAARRRLVDRGLIDEAGLCTDGGRDLRAAIEAHTDRLALEPLRRLGDDGARELIDALDPIVTRLVDTGAVAASWPPKSVTA